MGRKAVHGGFSAAQLLSHMLSLVIGTAQSAEHYLKSNQYKNASFFGTIEDIFTTRLEE